MKNLPTSRHEFSTLPFEGIRSTVRSDRISTSFIELTHQNFTKEDLNIRLLASLITVLYRYKNADDVCITLYGSGKFFPLSVNPRPESRHSNLTEQIKSALSNRSDEQTEASTGILFNIDGMPAPAVNQDITLTYEQESHRLTADYDARLLNPEIVQNTLQHVLNVLNDSMENPNATIESIKYQSDQELSFLNKIGLHDYAPRHHSMADLIQGSIDSNNSTVEFEKEEWAFNDLMSRADQIIGAVSSRIKRDERVGICLRPGKELISALLAAIRLNATIVPLDTTLPTDRLSAICSDANLAIIITEKSLADSLPDKNLVSIEEILPTEAGVPVWPNGKPTPDSPLYLLFTSGSTGRPKGVLVAHRTLANLLLWENQQRPTAGKRTLGRTSIAFDVGFQEVFSTILFGGTLVIISDEERADIENLAGLMAKHRIARAYIPPVALHQMAESSNLAGAEIKGLEHVIVAGEQLRISKAIRNFFRATNSRLVNQYGPTETHVATEETLGLAPLRWPDLPSIGRPIAGAHIRIVDTSDTPTPVLVAGEVIIGGVLPAIGYISQPTEQPSRFCQIAGGQRFYRTGDKARWRLDGTLEFLGRMDDQIKIRGYRVELADLEANASLTPGVSQAAAKFWPTPEGGYLALYLLLNADRQLSTQNIRAALRQRVPNYMIPPPNAISILDHFPLTSGGKVDRSKLPEPKSKTIDDEGEIDIFTQLRGIWTRSLNLDDFDISENFLNLGGHSLLAIQMASEINDTFNITIPLSLLLRGTSLKDLSELVEQTVTTRDSQNEKELPSTKSSPAHPSNEPIPPQKFKTVDLPCGRLITPAPSEARHLWKEIYEQRAYEGNKVRFNKGDVIVDVGANIGIFSRFCLEMTGGCTLIAIEPARELFQCLKQNLPDVVTCLNVGCGSNDTDIKTFSFFPQVPAMSSFYPNEERDSELLNRLLENDPIWVEANSESQKNSFLKTAFEADHQHCSVRSLSSIFATLGLTSIHLLKIDVQRGEEDILAGLRVDDWQKIQQIVIEMQDHDDSVSRVESLCRTHGFIVDLNTIPLHERTNVRFIYACKG